MNWHDDVRGFGWLVAKTIAILAIGGTANAQFSNLHNLNSDSDGDTPRGGVLLSGTTLFGTTNSGGENFNGTIWSLDTNTNNFDNRHDFSSVSDGNAPQGKLAVAGTTLYGAASNGGANFNGTIWSLDLNTNNFNNLHDFNAASDGNGALGGVILSGTTLYGAGVGGGANSNGTIWSFDTSTNTFNNLHDFSSSTDGSNPSGGIVLSGTTLFGAASAGGANTSGTIWSFDTSTSNFSNLHDFSAASDGTNPLGGVALAGTTLFGTSNAGGANGVGTIWSLDTGTNSFNNLHDFNFATDGDGPQGGVVVAGTTLFGTATDGGTFSSGTVWSLDVSTSNFNNLHNFIPASDGGRPRGAVTLAGNALFGTAYIGGANGDGTIWSFTVPEPSGAALAASGLIALMGCSARRRRGTRTIR